MKKSALRRLPENEESREFIARLEEKYKHGGTAQEARRAVDKAMGDRRLTDVLYEMRRERPV